MGNWTAAENRLAQRLDTPEKVQAWLRSIPYNWERRGETCRTLRGVLRHRTAHCLEAALSSAALQERHGHEPLLLDIESTDGLDHVLHLWRRDGLWGTVGRSRCGGLHGRRAMFASIPDLVRSYMAPFVDQTGRVKGYGVLDLRNLPTGRWRLDSGNVWHVERALIDNRHTRLAMPEAEYRLWKRRFDAWWDKNGRPDHEWPTHYPDRATWL